jgi:hypothetical protein
MTTEDDIGDALTLLAEHARHFDVRPRQPRADFRPHPVSRSRTAAFCDGDERRRLPASGKITFVTTLRSAKLQFRLSKDDWDPLPGQPLHIPMVFLKPAPC